MDYGVAKEPLTRFASLPFVARLARFLDLSPIGRPPVRVQHRRLGRRDDVRLLALILSLCTGAGHFSTGTTLGADTAACRAARWRAVPGRRRLGEFLTRLSAQALAGSPEGIRLVVRHLVPIIMRHCVETPEYVPVLVDGTGFEVQGHQCEGMARAPTGRNRTGCIRCSWAQLGSAPD